jgi:muramidase (phage lysozyme)
MTPNEVGFLSMVRYSEGTSLAPNPYATTFGYEFTITDFADHPTLLGTWPGVTQKNGQHTTAAGAYQFEARTWLSCKRVYAAKDFSAAEQDRIALCLVNERHALDAINAGDIETAIAKCAAEWASLPGSQSGQPQRRIADLLAAYNSGRANA